MEKEQVNDPERKRLGHKAGLPVPTPGVKGIRRRQEERFLAFEKRSRQQENGDAG